jgi:hypothetical protein
MMDSCQVFEWHLFAEAAGGLVVHANSARDRTADQTQQRATTAVTDFADKSQEDDRCVDRRSAPSQESCEPSP